MNEQNLDLVRFVSASDYASADAALEAYAESFVRTQLGGVRVLHKNAAAHKIRATALYSLLMFLVISVRMFYHEVPATLWYTILAVLTFTWCTTLRRSGSGAALRKKMAEMPDAEIENVLISECDNMVSRSRVELIEVLMLGAAAVLLLVFFMKPHMIFEKNADGYGVRYYTYSLLPEEHIVVPHTWKGEPVTEIRGHVFCSMNSFSGIRLPRGLREIRGNTFEDCRKLRSIVIPEGVTRIGGHAFRRCRELESVTVPSTLQYVGSSAFRDCSSLKRITLPVFCEVNERAFKDSPTEIIRK